MDAALRRRFARLEKLGYERPKKFDYFRALGEIHHWRPYLEGILGRRLEMDDRVQDASHFTQLSDPTCTHADWASGRQVAAGMRFSKFDRMFVIFDGGCWGAAADELRAFLAKQGFHEVPLAALLEPYDGQLAGGPGTEDWNWFRRFFDWM